MITNSNEEVEIFDTNFNLQPPSNMMYEFDNQMQVGPTGSYSLIGGNWNGMVQTMKSVKSPLQAFIALNACKKKNNDGTPFFNENNTCLLQADGNGVVNDNAYTQIVQHILSMQPGSYYNVIFTDSHEVDVVFFKNYDGGVSMIIIDSNGMCIDTALAKCFIGNIKNPYRWPNCNSLITQELVIGTNGIGNGSGYCGAFAQNMLYTLEKNNSQLLKELISFTKPYNLLTPLYFTDNSKDIGDYVQYYKSSNDISAKPTFIRCINDALTQAQPFMQEILLNTVQHRKGPYLSKYKSKTDNKTHYTNIYLHFSTFAQVLSEPFLLANVLYDGKQIDKNFDINHDDIQKMLNITKQHMPKLHNKIQTSIKNQQYINSFMKSCGYEQDNNISKFLMWIPTQLRYYGITYDIFTKAFDVYVKDVEKQENKNTFTINDNYTNNNNNIANNTHTINRNENFITNTNTINRNEKFINNTQMQTQTNNDDLSAPKKPKYNLLHCLNNNYIGYDDDGCHCCNLW